MWIVQPYRRWLGRRSPAKTASSESLLGKTDAEIAQKIYDATSLGKVVILATPDDALDFRPNHAYYVIFAGPDGTGGNKILLYDPHGKADSDKKVVDLSRLSKNFSGISIGDLP